MNSYTCTIYTIPVGKIGLVLKQKPDPKKIADILVRREKVNKELAKEERHVITKNIEAFVKKSIINGIFDIAVFLNQCSKYKIKKGSRFRIILNRNLSAHILNGSVFRHIKMNSGVFEIIDKASYPILKKYWDCSGEEIYRIRTRSVNDKRQIAEINNLMEQQFRTRLPARMFRDYMSLIPQVYNIKRMGERGFQKFKLDILKRMEKIDIFNHAKELKQFFEVLRNIIEYGENLLVLGYR